MKSNTFKIHLKLALVVLGFFISSLDVSATHYRYGSLTYEVLSETGSGAGKQTTVSFTITQGWRTSAFFGATPAIGTMVATDFIDFGQGTGASVILTVTAVNAVEDWFLGSATITKVYTGNTDVTAFLYSCCRISTLQGGNADDDYRSQAVVTLSQTNNDNPVANLPAIINVPIGQAGYVFNLNAFDPNGHAITYALATTTESGLSPNNPVIYSSVNSGTGAVTLNTNYVGAAVGHLWALQFMMTDALGATSPIDFIIRVVAQSNPPQFVSPTPPNGNTIKVPPGTPINFTIAASDADVADVVTLLGSGIPVGATFSPGAPANPISVPFSWTPTIANLGSYSVTFSATDNNAAQALTTVNIIVSLAPIFDVPPTPATATHLVVVPSNNLSFTVKATDPDPLDDCQITNATGKDMANNPIPIYAGVTFNPVLPTPAGNSTQTVVSWTPTQAQWGHRHMIFTATDGYNDQATHEVSIIVNTPPAFQSSPITAACVGQLYTYNVVATDADLGQGDMLDLYGLILPAWLTFTDNGNGTGTLSGTPGAGDVGAFNIDIEAQDMHHHQNGATVQAFAINVSVCGGNPCGPATVTVTADGLNALWVNAGASAPNTFYYGVTDALRVNAAVAGGVGPFTYAWSNSGTNFLLPRFYYPASSIDLYRPTAATTITCTVTDQGTGCVYTGTLAVNWDDQFFCGKVGNTWNLYMCVNGQTQCVTWTQARNILKANPPTATLGQCNVPAKTSLVSSSASFSVYPNPSSGIFTLEMPIASKSNGTVEVMDVNGRALFAETLNLPEGVLYHSIDLSALPNGIYVVRVATENEFATERIQIIR
jgi:hypothetical protein